MRKDDVPLQERALRSRNPRLRQQAEPGVDSVRGLIARGQSGRRGVRIANRAHRRSFDLDLHRTRIDAPQLAKSERAGAQLQKEVFVAIIARSFPPEPRSGRG